MAFIDHSSEIKKHNSAVDKVIDLTNVQSFIDDAINTKLIPGIGRDQYESLIAGKLGFADGTKQKTVFDLLQKAGVNFMLGEYTDSGALIISNAGISVAKGNNSMPASDTKLMKFKRKCLNDGFNNLELAIQFLEKNVVDFPLYGASDERKSNNALMINSSMEFQAAGVNIGSSAQLYNTLRIYQQAVEENNIIPILGSGFYDAFKALSLVGGLGPKQAKLLEQLRKAIAYFTMLEAIPYMAVSLDASGVYELSQTIGGSSANLDSRSPASTQRLQMAMGQFYNRANTQINTIEAYLKANSTDFPLYVVPGSVSINDGSASNVYAFL
jgi:hypothetical protein